MTDLERQEGGAPTGLVALLFTPRLSSHFLQSSGLQTATCFAKRFQVRKVGRSGVADSQPINWAFIICKASAEREGEGDESDSKEGSSPPSFTARVSGTPPSGISGNVIKREEVVWVPLTPSVTTHQPRNGMEGRLKQGRDTTESERKKALSKS